MKGKLFWIGGVVALLLAIVVTVGLAQETVIYYACVNNSSGTIHMIDVEDACNNNEIRIEWNQKGPKGDTGPKGDQGDPGLPGANGADGAPGADGADGAPGEDGLHCWDLNGNFATDIEEDGNGDGSFDALDCQGPEGAVGPQGPQGEQGPAGEKGDQGFPGEGLPQYCLVGQVAVSTGTNEWQCVTMPLIEPGTGLESSGDEFVRTLSLEGPFQLPQNCADDSRIRFNSITWEWECSPRTEYITPEEFQHLMSRIEYLESIIDGDGDGYPISDDCNDSNPNINPGAVEICDSIDNDCDGQVDEIAICQNQPPEWISVPPPYLLVYDTPVGMNLYFEAFDPDGDPLILYHECRGRYGAGVECDLVPNTDHSFTLEIVNFAPFGLLEDWVQVWGVVSDGLQNIVAYVEIEIEYTSY